MPAAISEQQFAESRRHMVDAQLRARDITDPDVLDAMLRVPRHRFVPQELQAWAYVDHPLPLTDGQTISQPYIVALMTQLARVTRQSKALEIGVGSGYQTAILAELCGEVFGIEIVTSLATSAVERLAQLGYRNVTIRNGDGYAGWSEESPFDVILVAAAPPHIPPLLVEQLAPGGRLVLPVGDFQQHLVVVEKSHDGVVRQLGITPVAFVPMTGEAQRSSVR